MASRPLPTGTVTFLFSDIEGSTRLVQDLDTDSYRELVEQHHRLIRDVAAAHGGAERGTQGDSFLVIYRDAPTAVAAAVQAQRLLGAATWPGGATVRVRMGLHTGVGTPGGDDYVGVDINRAARIAAAAHGGQVLLSEATRALSARSLGAGIELRDLGQHRLRGLDEPERLYQLVINGLPSDFAAPNTAGRPGGRLPDRLTTFLGRGEDLDALQELVAGNRLVTIVGPGGTGKTSIAVEFARQASASFADGAWFTPLDSVADPELAGPAIVAALDLRGTVGSARERLIDNLAERNLLLVLDNFEHVLGAAPLIGELLSAAPQLRIVVTSRAPLRLAAEQLYPLRPLSEPTSVELFVDRARRVDPRFALSDANRDAVAEVCRRLDGLPLAIELAAARMRLFGAAALRDRLVAQLPLPASPLVDAPERQRTLDGAIAWSEALLDDPNRRLLAWLSVFAGGWTVDQLEEVCSDACVPRSELLERLDTLLDHSLVSSTELPTGIRFELLETIRQFAAGRLERSGEDGSARRRHATAYLALAEHHAPALERSGRVAAVERLNADRGNLWAALRWATDHGEADVALRLCAALGPYWGLQGETEAGLAATRAALALPGAERPTAARMRALDVGGGMAYYRSELSTTVAMYSAQLDVARQIGDELGVVDARFNLLFTEDWRGREEEGLAQTEQVRGEYAKLGNDRGATRADWLISTFLWDLGRRAEAIELGEQLVARFRDLDDPRYESMTAGNLGAAALALGDQAAALGWFLHSVTRAEELADVAGIVPTLELLAAAAAQLVGLEAAATTIGAFDALSRRYGVRMPLSLSEFMATDEVDFLAAATATRADPNLTDARERGAAMDAHEIVAYLREALGAALAQAPAGASPAP